MAGVAGILVTAVVVQAWRSLRQPANVRRAAAFWSLLVVLAGLSSST